MLRKTLKDVSYVLRSVASQEQWDDFVSAHPDGHLLQSWSWGELKASVGWQPLRLGLWKGKELVAVAQVLRRTVPHVPLWVAHMAYVPKGPLVDWSQTEMCSAFLAQLKRYLSKRGAPGLWMELGQEVGSAAEVPILQQLASLSTQSVPTIQPLRTIVLDLSPDEETLLAQMKEKWRYNVRLARRKGVSIRVASSPEDVQAWYALLQTTGERDSFGIHTLNYYQRVWQLFAARNELCLLLAEYKGQLLAGIFVSLYARKALYLYGASSNEQRQLMPNYLLQWEAIRWARQQGAQVYDFWGIPATDDEDEAMAGVYRFKSGWGGRIVQFLGCHVHVYQPLTMKVVRRSL